MRRREERERGGDINPPSLPPLCVSPASGVQQPQIQCDSVTLSLMQRDNNMLSFCSTPDSSDLLSQKQQTGSPQRGRRQNQEGGWCSLLFSVPFSLLITAELRVHTQRFMFHPLPVSTPDDLTGFKHTTCSSSDDHSRLQM